MAFDNACWINDDIPLKRVGCHHFMLILFVKSVSFSISIQNIPARILPAFLRM